MTRKYRTNFQKALGSEYIDASPTLVVKELHDVGSQAQDLRFKGERLNRSKCPYSLLG